MSRALFTFAVAFVATAISATSASGALFLMFSGTQAKPGDSVFVQTGGRGALHNMSTSSVRVFFAPADEASAITSPKDTRLVYIGRLRIDDEGNGYLHFKVPEVAAGDYTTFLHCPRCASGSAGRELLPGGPVVGSFVVMNSGRRPWLLVLLAAGAAVAAIGTALAWMIRRTRVVEQ